MVHNNPIQSIAILGDGIDAWMSASFLATFLAPSITINMVGTSSPPTLTTPATLPTLKSFFGLVGLTEPDVIAACHGTMKLGTQFVNWGTLGNRYFHPHGTYAPDFDVVALHQWWLKARGEEKTSLGLDELSMAWGLARENRFVHPVPDRRLIQSSHDYGYHLDPDLVRDTLRNLALSRGVQEARGQFSTATLDPTTGYVVDIQTNQGDAISADLFLDCSGCQALLIGQTLNVDFVDWSDLLPCDRAVMATSAHNGVLEPFTKITQREAGWQWRTHLQKDTRTGYVFASAFASDDDATAVLLDNLEGRLSSDPVVVAFQNGRRKQTFCKNVVALGDAAGFLEPLEATHLHLLQTTLTRLLSLWPRTDFNPTLCERFNQSVQSDWEAARDFILLHYKATNRTDMPLWRQAAEINVPYSLQDRIDLWRDSGRIVPGRNDVFPVSAWLSVFVGQHVQATTWDALADTRAARVDYVSLLANIAQLIGNTAASLPDHASFIDKMRRGSS